MRNICCDCSGKNSCLFARFKWQKFIITIVVLYYSLMGLSVYTKKPLEELLENSWEFLHKGGYVALVLLVLLLLANLKLIGSFLYGLFFWDKVEQKTLCHAQEGVNDGKDATDALGWTEFASKVLNQINSFAENRKSNEGNIKGFTCGLLGQWGDGKSYIIEKMSQEIAKKDIYKDYYMFKIQPWASEVGDCEANVTNAFFDELEVLLSRMNRCGYISSSINKYKKAITNDKVRPFLDVFCPDKTFVERRREIQKAINKTGKRFIVVIDDIDRLERHEIMAIFRLVRATADFENIIFLMAMDKEEVSKKIQDEVDNKQGYLEKIINLEFPLPAISEHKVLTFLKSELKKLNWAKKSDLDEIIFRFYKRSQIKNIREVKKIINKMQSISNYEAINEKNVKMPLKKFTDMSVFLCLEILLKNKPELYNSIKEQYVINNPYQVFLDKAGPPYVKYLAHINPHNMFYYFSYDYASINITEQEFEDILDKVKQGCDWKDVFLDLDDKSKLRLLPELIKLKNVADVKLLIAALFVLDKLQNTHAGWFFSELSSVMSEMNVHINEDVLSNLSENEFNDCVKIVEYALSKEFTILNVFCSYMLKNISKYKNYLVFLFFNWVEPNMNKNSYPVSELSKLENFIKAITDDSSCLETLLIHGCDFNKVVSSTMFKGLVLGKQNIFKQKLEESRGVVSG